MYFGWSLVLLFRAEEADACDARRCSLWGVGCQIFGQSFLRTGQTEQCRVKRALHLAYSFFRCLVICVRRECVDLQVRLRSDFERNAQQAAGGLEVNSCLCIVITGSCVFNALHSKRCPYLSHITTPHIVWYGGGSASLHPTSSRRNHCRARIPRGSPAPAALCLARRAAHLHPGSHTTSSNPSSPSGCLYDRMGQLSTEASSPGLLTNADESIGTPW